jgi:hypothetical protein
MELDELKTAWRELERRLDENTALTGQLLREKRLDKTRWALRRIAWGQSLQIVIWIVIISIVAPFWIQYRSTPHFLVAGLVMHLYGIATIILSVRRLALIANVNYGKPVVELQARIACLRRARVQDQLWLGLPWWILWIVATMIGAQRWLGLDIYAPAPAWVWWTIAIGIIGIALTLWLPRVFANTPRGSRFLQNTLDNLAGRSLVRAARQLDEIAQFSRE